MKLLFIWIHLTGYLSKTHSLVTVECGNAQSTRNVDSTSSPSLTVIHLFQPDSLELREHVVMFQSITLQGQAGLSLELLSYIRAQFRKILLFFVLAGNSS